jgi:transposase
MANQLKMRTVQSILTLRERRWSFRRIARTLGVHRDTVSRYVRAAEASKSANAPIGSVNTEVEGLGGLRSAAPGLRCARPIGEPGHDDNDRLTNGAHAPPGSSNPKPANAPTGSGGRTSDCAPFREIIQGKVEQGLSAVRIHQDLTGDHDAEVSYHSVKRFVNRLKGARPLPFRRMECEPGEEAQIDFGTGAPIRDSDGKRRRTHVLRIVLSHSRKSYSEAVRRQTTEDFIRCIENAFHHFGGVPKTLVVDNLKAAVIKADWFDPDLNPKIQAFCEHYGTVILPTKPRTPRHKGKVEAGVKYVQANALKGRTFASLHEQNRFLKEWEVSVADTRIHGTTRKQVSKVFEEVERESLLPLPVNHFPFFQEAQRSVHRDGHVEVDKAYYSVPPEYLGRRLWVRWDCRTVRIFDKNMQQITMHIKHDPGRFSTRSEHIASEKIAYVERGTSWLLNKVSLIGPHAQLWAESMVQERGIQGVRVLVGLMSLAKRHPDKSIEKACETAQTHGAYRLRTIRELIKRQAPKQEQFEFMQEHRIIRNISEYGDLIRNAFMKGKAI